jgi:hypothetical protein
MFKVMALSCATLLARNSRVHQKDIKVNIKEQYK